MVGVGFGVCFRVRVVIVEERGEIEVGREFRKGGGSKSWDRLRLKIRLGEGV